MNPAAGNRARASVLRVSGGDTVTPPLVRLHLWGTGNASFAHAPAHCCWCWRAREAALLEIQLHPWAKVSAGTVHILCRYNSQKVAHQPISGLATQTFHSWCSHLPVRLRQVIGDAPQGVWYYTASCLMAFWKIRRCGVSVFADGLKEGGQKQETEVLKGKFTENLHFTQHLTQQSYFTQNSDVNAMFSARTCVYLLSFGSI